ncbi:plectin isoform X2 [Drosophila innubila]|uniref:plectin isoform X2 n=1 Tax=Drosophila innubila TaxID=198719 RepID=UPI00148CF506|nr:plectin isoform X2 [Drosophila innubila]
MRDARMLQTDVPTPAITATTPTTPTTMTQMSQNMSTKIDMDSPRTVETAKNDDVSSDVDDVLKTTCDNELNAHEQTLNLNVEAEGVGERKEIEHQQAENFNDAFGRRHDNNDNKGEGDDVDDDAMNAMSTSINAKNKREICEQSKLETTAAAHNELNMTKEQQSICLASEQIQSQTIGEPTAAATSTAAASNRQQRISDARGSSPEQVDGQQRQQIANDCQPVKFNVTQTDTEPATSSSSSSSGHPSIEFLKCAVRELLEVSGANSFPVVDLDLLDLLSELLQLIVTPINTGNFWSEPLIEQVASECVDMTVSKVSEESEATAAVVDIYSEQIEQPSELDDSNNNSNNNSSSNNNQCVDMKYDVLRSSSRLPETLPSRLSSTATAIAPATSRIRDVVTPTVPLVTAAAATSRIRDVVIPTVAPITAATTTSRIRDAVVPTATTVRPLLSELKRNSSSRDDVSIDVDSLLPERTRLRRQRRMRSQDSVEEKPEDVIERLNKLKERISGALSEVKGVLKQYSTESEAEAAGEKWLGPPTSSLPKVENEPEAGQPVQFRFVKKLRRRSYFDEADEEKIQEKEQSTAENTKDNESQTKSEKESAVETTTKASKEQELTKANQASKTKEKDELKKPREEEAEQKINKTVTTAKEEKEQPLKTQEKQEQTKVIDASLSAKIEEEKKKSLKETEEPIKAKEEKQQLKEQQDKPAINGELPLKTVQKDKVQAKIEFLAKVQSELKSKPKTKEAPTVKEQSQEAIGAAAATNQQPQPVEAVEATPQTATLPKESATQPANLDEGTKLAASETTASVGTKKKTIVKLRNPRRASIAAVEPSKIVPEPVQIDALAQRRPSDSEAIVKRKKKLNLTSSVTNVTGKPTTSGTTAAATQLQEQQQQQTVINEQLVAAKVDGNVNTAKRETKPIAKSVERDEKRIEAATAAAATAPAAATTTTATATAATATVTAAPKQLPIDQLANKATASEQSRRASLKLAELVGETVLVVPTATTQDLTATAAATTTAATTETVSTVNSSSFSQSKEPINQPAIIPATQQKQVVVHADIEVAPVDVVVSSTPQIAATLSEVPHDESSLHKQQQQQQQHIDQEQQQLVEATKDNAQEQSDDSLVVMPELKVLAGPVQPVKIETVEQPHDESDLSVIKKKSPHLKKLVRKSSIDKGKEKVNESAKLTNILKDKNKISNLTDRINKATPPKKQTKAAKEQAAATVADTEQQQENAEKELQTETATEPESELEPQPDAAAAPKPKKPRQIKKKVIIKRQKRRLSIGDTFFIQQEPEEPKVPEIETIEKAIAYVTDDEDDVEPEPEPEPAKPLKSCLHVREYKIGDLILYAERYRKTQVRWKRGRVLERITSISYKLEIEGKEVPAHISYIKKYTGRKVKFVGKEYLDIDYEQVVEEERRARSYSIWNMV